MHVYMNELATKKEQIIMSKKVWSGSRSVSESFSDQGRKDCVRMDPSKLNLLYCMYLVVP